MRRSAHHGLLCRTLLIVRIDKKITEAITFLNKAYKNPRLSYDTYELTRVTLSHVPSVWIISPWVQTPTSSWCPITIATDFHLLCSSVKHIFWVQALTAIKLWERKITEGKANLFARKCTHTQIQWRTYRKETLSGESYQSYQSYDVNAWTELWIHTPCVSKWMSILSSARVLVACVIRLTETEQ